jgi:hypothetical protein
VGGVRRIALLREGESPVLPGRGRKTGRGHSGCRWSPPAETHAFLFQVPLKPTLPHGRAGPGGSHPIMSEWGGGQAVPSQVRVLWPGHPQATHEPQTFPPPSLPHHGRSMVKVVCLFEGPSHSCHVMTSEQEAHNCWAQRSYSRV